MNLTDLARSLAPYSGGLLALACLGLLVAMGFEQAQIVAKYRGARRGVVATGYNNAMKLLVANRLGAVTYLFFVALVIDLGMSPGRLAASLAVTVLAASLLNLVLLGLLVRSESGWSLGANIGAMLRGGRRQTLAIGGAFFATLFGFSGLTIPLIWSAANPELRLTLANSGFLFNSLFTLINVFLVESEIARKIDTQCHQLRPMVQGLYLMRFLGGLAAAPLLLLAA